MRKILNFTDFITEASFSIPDPTKAGQELSQILGQSRNVKEIPRGSNKGPEVEAYLKSVGLGGGYPWCQAYVYWVLDQLSKKLGVSNPAPKEAAVKSHWDRSDQENKITIGDARANPSKVRPGMVFIMQRNTPWSQGGYEGHTGIVININPEARTFTSIEGNTDEKATGEGNKVGINTRKLEDKNLIGFIDWFKGKRTPEFETAIAGSGVTPELKGDNAQGEITSQFMSPTTVAPNQNVVGDRSAEQAALDMDSQTDKSLLGYLLSPWKKSDIEKGAQSPTVGQTRQFRGLQTFGQMAAKMDQTEN